MFITFEGTEGSGKSSLIKSLSLFLADHQIQHIVTREPGGPLVSEKIRQLILHETMSELTELLLYEAARAEHFQEIIKPALKKKVWVLCDRFIDSSIAYQGHARGIDLKVIHNLNKIATENQKPKLTFLLDLPVEIGLNRATNPNRFEKEDIKFHKKVRKGFLSCAKIEPKRFRVLKVNSKSPEQVLQLAIRYLSPFLKD